ncbi:MAG: S41 family peptidase [Bacteroidota bacterium]
MKVLLLVGALILSSCPAIPQTSTSFHPIVQRAMETSLYSSRVDWKAVNARFVELTEGKEGVEELKPGLQYLINSLGDKHGHIRSATDHSIVVYYQGKIAESSDLERDAEFVTAVINDVSAEFSYRLLEDGIGYLRVVGIGPGDVQAQADLIRDGLKALKEKGADRWIVDLRFNGGGNMEPMIAGLAPLIGKGKIGGAMNSKGEISRQYSIENGQFNHHGRIPCEMADAPKIGSKEKVAVLLSRYTISSGEMVAVTFKGRPHTRFFGEATAGYTTGNGYDPITEDLVLIISQDVFADRNDKAYRKYVDVDEEIPFPHRTDLRKDPQFERAVQWLKGK